MTLYHYTCDHGRLGIGMFGLVQPICLLYPEVYATMKHDWLGRISWFTDLDVATHAMLGFNKRTQGGCNRMKYRYVVTQVDAPILPWTQVAKKIAPLRDVIDLNLFEGGLPLHWFVTGNPIEVALDEKYETSPLLEPGGPDRGDETRSRLPEPKTTPRRERQAPNRRLTPPGWTDRRRPG